MNDGNLGYGEMFAEVLDQSIRTLLSSSWRRKRNPGAPFSFGENHLRKQIRSYRVPSEWPQLVVERKVRGDLEGPGKSHGGVDFFFIQQTTAISPKLTDVLASCEVGGPTRPKLLLGSKNNWYPKIVADIRKQAWRATVAPTGEHYLGLMIKPGPDSIVRKEFPVVLKSMLEEVPEANLVEVSWSELTDVGKLTVIVLRVMPK